MRKGTDPHLPKTFSLEDYEYIFIVTYGRSGSTLLQSILGGIESVKILGENYNALYGIYRSVESVRLAHDKFGADSEPYQPWYGAHRYDPDRFAKNLVSAFVQDVLQPTADVRMIGFKEIRYFGHSVDTEKFLDFVLSVFPNSKIVFNQRSSEGVKNSGWFKKREPAEVEAWVNMSDAIMRSYSDAHPDRTIIVNYDQYIKSPQILRELHAFLGLDYDDAYVAEILGCPLKHGKRP